MSTNQSPGEAFKELLQSDHIRKLLPYLLSGGVGALAGGVMTGGRRKSDGESRGGHLSRVLGNALIAAGLAGGSHYLLNKGLGDTVGAVEDGKGITGSKPEESPLASTVRNVAFSPLTALGSGAMGLAATHNREFIGSGAKDTAKIRENLAQKMKGVTDADLKYDSAKEIGARKIPTEKRRAAGLPSDEIVRSKPGQKTLLEKIFKGKARDVKGAISTATRRGPLATFGQTTPRRIGRGALGLAFAGLPALAGAFLTDKPE